MFLADEVATQNGGWGVMQYVLIAFIALLLIAYPFFMSRRNKRENQKAQEQANSLKRGDEVITSAGVYGKVLEVKQDGDAKKVVIETGNEKNKSYLTVDAYCIYTVLNKEVKEPKEEKKTPENEQKTKKSKKKESIEKAEEKTEEVPSSEEKKEEVKEQAQEEIPQPEQQKTKAKNSNSSKKKKN